MNETTLNILISSGTGLLIALITVGGQIIVELIKAPTEQRSASDSREGRSTSLNRSPHEPRTVHNAIRRVKWGIPVFGAFIAVLIMISLLVFFQPSDKRIPIESIPLNSVPYGGASDLSGGQGLSSLSLIVDNPSQIGYRLDYSLPDTGDGYAGLAFTFLTPQDLSDYEAIEVTIRYGDEQARGEIFFKDITNQVNGVRLGDTIPPSTDVSVTTEGQKQTIHIPLKTNFGAVNLDVVKEIGFHAHTDFSRGQHAFTVSEIVFLKP